MAIKERGIEIKQSRISFLYNYLLITLVLILFALVWKQFNLTFTFFPKNFSEFSKTLVSFLFLALIAFLLEEPEIRRLFCKYVITNNEVIKIEGILRKRRTIIPYQSVANVGVYKGITGRVLNFGDIKILGFKDQIDIHGVKDPEVLYRIINNKIAVMRGTKHAVVSRETTERGKVSITDWREEQKRLEKEVHPPTSMDERKIFRLFKWPTSSKEPSQEEFEESSEIDFSKEAGIAPPNISKEIDTTKEETVVKKVKKRKSQKRKKKGKRK